MSIKKMKHLPKLAIVGRPNVGKSALFNRICKKKISIVDEAEGVTRDRLYAEADLFGFKFQVIDTGGINARSTALFNEEIKRQAEIAIEEADSLVLVVDAQVGITDLDKDLATILLRTKKPLCLAVNKVDELSKGDLIHQFHSLGVRSMVAVSAAQSLHIAELLEAAFASFPRDQSELEVDESIKVAIVGRPNVGKSSLINYLLDENRCIVSPVPGTTRDSIDISFHIGEKRYTLIDTAGIRRKHAEHEVVDKFAAIRTERAIERADICILMLDAQEGITTQEKKIANDIEEAGKGCILIFNKWDLVKGFRMEHCLREVEEEVRFLKHCPKIFISALTGRNVDKIFDVVNQVSLDSKKRITTHQLNKFIGETLQKNHPPMLQGKRLRIYYMAQVSVEPPKFILFVNYPNLMLESYKKYLYNQFRETYGFLGVPILFHLKGKQSLREAAHEKPPVGKELAPLSEEEELLHANDDDDFDEEKFIKEHGW
jgi:GTP-binding protein